MFVCVRARACVLDKVFSGECHRHKLTSVDLRVDEFKHICVLSLSRALTDTELHARTHCCCRQWPPPVAKALSQPINIVRQDASEPLVSLTDSEMNFAKKLR